MDPDSYDQKRKKANVVVRQMEIDDIATVFHLGERLFTAKSAPNLFRTWDEYEVINFFQNDSEYCLVAKPTTTWRMWSVCARHDRYQEPLGWKYGYLVWLGLTWLS